MRWRWRRRVATNRHALVALAATHEVVVPLAVEMSAPLRAATTTPAHGLYSLNAVVSTPEPRVSEKNAERKPNMARAGATISMVVRPCADSMPWISPLRAVSLSITKPACSSSTSTHTCTAEGVAHACMHVHAGGKRGSSFESSRQGGRVTPRQRALAWVLAGAMPCRFETRHISCSAAIQAQAASTSPHWKQRAR